MPASTFRPRQLVPVLAVVLAVLVTGACAKKKDKFAGVSGDYDYVSGTPLPDRVEGSNFLGGNVDRAKFPPVYFAYDSHTVDGSEMARIQNVAGSLKATPKDVIIAGFTDERGTEEYNRGLGELRAQSVRQALISLGVDANRLQTVSFGEELPADTGGGDSAWAKNRRAEFGVLK